MDSATRSAIMSKVRSKDTRPEIEVRKALHKAGYRFRVHRTDLPGKPDLILPRYRLALFVHGCFWHQHGCKRTTIPATNREFWSKKFRRNLERDERVQRELNEAAWTTAVIWECQIKAGISRVLEILTGMAQPRRLVSPPKNGHERDRLMKDSN